MGRHGNCGGCSCSCGSEYKNFYGANDCRFDSCCRYPRRWSYGLERNDGRNRVRDLNTPSFYLANKNKWNTSRRRGFPNINALSDYFVTF